MQDENNHTIWQTVLGEIELSVSRASYITWFKNTELGNISRDGIVEIIVPNIFAKQQFEVKFNTQISSILKKNGITVTKILYSIEKQKAKKPANNRLATVLDDISVQRSKPENATRPATKNGLNPRYTFDNFIVGSSNELAYAAGQAVSHNPGEKYNPLFIYGGVGLGKTHLIQAVGNEILRSSPETNLLYLSSETFVNEFVENIRYKKSGFADKYRSVDVLIVDDMQFIAGKEKTQEEFFHTFNTLHQANKQIIIGSDKPPKSIPTLTDRLRSRLEWGMAIDIQMPDFETRCAIIDIKATQSNVALPKETTEFLANNIKTNIRELEGALNQLLAMAELRGVTPDVEIAMGLLSNVKKTRPHHVTSRQIIDRTAKYFQIDAKDIISPKRDKHIVVPRQIAMYLLRSELHLSFPKIANELGRKDHTTAIHSIEKIDKASKLDLTMREHIAAIRDVLYG